MNLYIFFFTIDSAIYILLGSIPFLYHACYTVQKFQLNLTKSLHITLYMESMCLHIYTRKHYATAIIVIFVTKNVSFDLLLDSRIQNSYI